ncbi:MAG: DUF3368 domain-containing protein [Planctomycetota bacterium]
MKEPVVADSTCLIGLERIGRPDILPSLFDPITIPPRVHLEFGTDLPWLHVAAPADQPLVTTLKMLLGDGEAEAIALACEHGSRIILDDRQARSVAQHLGLSVIGTVGILIRAKRSGIVPSLKRILGELEAKGFYVSDALIEEALRLVGE